MAIGAAVRRCLPGKIERIAADLYRGVFVDLDKVAECLSAELPVGIRLLDIGGGDGGLLNRLLVMREDIFVDMVDIAEQVGNLLRPELESRVLRFPRTRLEQYAGTHAGRYAAILISDVLHHIPPQERIGFLKSMRVCLQQGGMALIKDVQPGHAIATLGLYCDRYLSGDRGATLISMQALRDLLGEASAMRDFREVGLYSIDKPNYLVRVEFDPSHQNVVSSALPGSGKV